MKKKRIKENRYLAPAMSLLLVCTLLLSLILPDRSFSAAENRALAKSATVSLPAMEDGTTGRELNTWFSDQFPGRNMFFHLNYLIRKSAGEREIKDVFLGKGALLANPEAEKNDNISATINALNQFASLSGLPCYVMVCPSAATVQPHKLPYDAPVRGVSPAFDALAMNLNGPVNVDVRSALNDHNQEYIFYRTDHHWTTKGAGQGAKALLESMGIQADLNEFELMPVSRDFQGTLASKTGSIGLNDTIELAVSKNTPNYLVTWADGTKTSSIYNKAALDTKDQYQVFLGANQAKVRIDTDAQTNRSLLLFKDSYANSMIQYLLPYFSSITIVDPRYYFQDLDLVMASDLFTDIVFVYSYDTFATISSLKDLLNDWNSAHQAESDQETEG